MFQTTKQCWFCWFCGSFMSLVGTMDFSSSAQLDPNLDPRCSRGMIRHSPHVGHQFLTPLTALTSAYQLQMLQMLQLQNKIMQQRRIIQSSKENERNAKKRLWDFGTLGHNRLSICPIMSASLPLSCHVSVSCCNPLQICLSCGLGSWRCILMSLKSNLCSGDFNFFNFLAQEQNQKALVCAPMRCWHMSHWFFNSPNDHPLSSIITSRKLIILYHNYHDNQMVSLSLILSSIIIHYH